MPKVNAREFDPITVDIIQNALGAISDEMFLSMAQAAMSSVIYEVLDFGVAITDADGELASAGAGIPGFVGMLDPAVKQIMRRYNSPGEIEEGDVFIANDPYEGGVSHANDIVLAMPVFSDCKLIAWTANKGHWVDIGGMAPGSLSPDATELFQEGLILPPVKIFSSGVQQHAIFEIIKANSRTPEQAIGDLWAGIAALRVGGKRLGELVQKYGADTVVYAIADYMKYGEKIALKGLGQLPNGETEATDTMDDGLKIKVKIIVKDDEMIVDLRENPDQLDGPINATYDTTVVAAQTVFKAVTAPEQWANAGSFRPLKVLTRPGSIFDAQRPAAVGLYYENKIRTVDLIWKALSNHMPDKMAAGHFSSICATIVRSLTADGDEKTFVEPEIGGWGGSLVGDGNNAQFSASMVILSIVLWKLMKPATELPLIAINCQTVNWVQVSFVAVKASNYGTVSWSLKHG